MKNVNLQLALYWQIYTFDWIKKIILVELDHFKKTIKKLTIFFVILNFKKKFLLLFCWLQKQLIENFFLTWMINLSDFVSDLDIVFIFTIMLLLVCWIRKKRSKCLIPGSGARRTSRLSSSAQWISFNFFYRTR